MPEWGIPVVFGGTPGVAIPFSTAGSRLPTRSI
jgi:hypothetical protein